MSSFSLSGGVEVLGFISPTDSLDTYAVIDPLYGIDGFRNVNLLSDLNLIPAPRRRAGMVVGVSGGTSYYKLNSSPWNYNFTDWSVFNTGGGGNLSGDYLPLSGGTVTGNTIFTQGVSANTFSATTYLGLPLDVYVTGGTFNKNTETLTLNRSDNNYVQVTGFTDIYTTGFTFNPSTYDISIERNDGVTFTESLSILASDLTVTGGTYDPNSGVATFTNNTGGTFNVSGFITGFTDIYTTGVTYSNNQITISDTANNTYSTFIDNFTGLTINGVLSATTISGSSVSAPGSTTQVIYNNSGVLSSDTGFVYSGGNVGIGTTTPSQKLDVNGNTIISSGLTATTISATTYQNLPVTADTFTTGFTYSNNTFTISRNQGQPSLTATINTVTGFTVNGNITVTGCVVPNLQILSSSSTITPVFGNDMVAITGQSANLTINNPTGSWPQGKDLTIRIKDNGVARTITWDTKYRSIGVTLPNTTVANKTTYVGMVYNSIDDKFDVIGSTTEL